jgi:hypothetical protein
MTTAIAVTDENIRESLLDIRKSVKNARGAIESNQVVDKDVHGTLTRVLSKIDAALDTLHSAALTPHGEEAAATPAPVPRLVGYNEIYKALNEWGRDHGGHDMVPLARKITAMLYPAPASKMRGGEE